MAPSLSATVGGRGRVFGCFFPDSLHAQRTVSFPTVRRYVNHTRTSWPTYKLQLEQRNRHAERGTDLVLATIDTSPKSTVVLARTTPVRTSVLSHGADN